MEIHWEDAIGVATDMWMNESTVQLSSASSLAVGYVIGETDTSITIISVVNRNDYAHGITIPKGCITRTVRLA